MLDGSRRVVVVLGMHRSGTSVLARGLQVLGVELSERLMPAAAHNPRGFWEDLDVVALNERIMAALSKDWRSPTLIADSQWHLPQLQGLAAEAEQLLQARLEQHHTWGVKDPRLCLLLPFWQPIFQRLGLVESYVIALRNPRAVVGSLEHRDQMVPELGCLLWLEHMHAALIGTTGKRRVLVDYDELLREPHRQLGRIATELQLPSPDSDAAALASFQQQFLDPELRHHEHSGEISSSDSHLIKVALKAFKSLQAVALEHSVAADDELRAVSDGIEAELHAVAPLLLLADQLDEHSQALTDLEAQLRRLRGDLLGEIHRLWNSSSWGLFRPGRNLIRRLRGHSNEIEPAPAREIDALRTMINMRESVSWELTAPLRLLHRMLRRTEAGATSKPSESQPMMPDIGELAVEDLSPSPFKVVSNGPSSRAPADGSGKSPPPLISVIIPSYNHRSFVAQAIDSVAAQDHPDLELIVVDDGSRDDSIRVIEEALKRASRLRSELHVQQNSGAHAAINRGLEMARGDYLSILNSDDYYYPHRLSALLGFMLQGDRQFAFSEVDHIDADGNKLPSTNRLRLEYVNALAALPRFPAMGFALLLYNLTVTSGNFLIERSLFERIGVFHPYRLVHDWDYVLRVLVEIEPGFLREPLMGYRVHQDNTLSNFGELAGVEGPKVIAHYFETVSRRKAPNRLAPTLYNWPNYFDRFVRSYPINGSHRLVDFVPAAMR